MILSTLLLPCSQRIDATTDTAVVIDVLRATSVITTALFNGATEIVTTSQVNQAFRIAESRHARRSLLCGERGCVAIEGFDLGNSPALYQRQRVEGRELVLTTTNGTQAIEAASQAKEVLIASFLNQTALLDCLNSNANVALVCAGTEGFVTLEDVLLAGAIATQCIRRFDAQLDDESMLASGLWQSHFGTDSAPELATLHSLLRQSRGGRNLIRLGFDNDISLCSQVDLCPVVPRRTESRPAVFANL